MIQDKQIARDFLMDSKASIIELTRAALEASSPQLKQILIQMRNQAEQSHEEIYHIAEKTGGYLPAALADHNHVNRAAQFIQQNMAKEGYERNQYTTSAQGYYQNPGNYGYGSNVKEDQGGSSYFENVNPLKGQGSQYYKNKY